MTITTAIETPTVSVYCDNDARIATVVTDPALSGEDWALLRLHLRELGAGPCALSDGPEFIGEYDVWTVRL